MGLFSSNKKPCPVCAKPTPRLLATKIEGQPLCGDCASRIDMDDDLRQSLTLNELSAHFNYLDENQILRDRFVTTKKISFGLFTAMILDKENKLICMNNKPDKTVFQGSELSLFSIKEDEELLFAGTKNGLERYESAVPARIAALAPEVRAAVQSAAIARQLAIAMHKDPEDRPEPQRINVPEPFHKFNISLRFNHPYRREFEFDLVGPTFDSQRPDCGEYMREYSKQAAEMEELALLLADIAFPGANEITNSRGGSAANSPAQGDAAAEIKKYKALMDEGIITMEEFAAKKKQLLGI